MIQPDDDALRVAREIFPDNSDYVSERVSKGQNTRREQAAALIRILLTKRERELRGALRKLVTQLKVCHSDPRYESVWKLYAIHGGKYVGPFYKEELAEAERLLAR